MDKEEIIARAVAGTERAKRYCDDVEFSPEDAARTEIDFLCEVVERAIAAGATTVNIPDTVGYATPTHMHRVISALVNRVPNIDQAVISTHCHDDLGLAVANSLAGVEAGARQIECTINGLGERAGNAALEEVVMALRTRQDHFQCTTGINTPRLCRTSQIVSSATGMKVQRNKSIVGQNAFAHEAGIHQHGILQERTTYEIMRPEDVGYVGSSLVLGKHSGRHAFRDRIESLGYTLDETTLQAVFEDFIRLADKKKDIYDADVTALIEQRSDSVSEKWKIVSCHSSAGTGTIPTATIQLEFEDGTRQQDAATGDGPIDAVFQTLERITGCNARLENFEVRSISGGKDALGEVTVVVQMYGRSYQGRGISTDIIEASGEAYLMALNRAVASQGDQGRSAPVPRGV
ncbi:MAG: 2-isopropylmalate synthase, partial [Planctomycetaceae bacterium]|nr:2-isopropylmalate synthase [Planctomycetaceae bacterium]